MVQRQKERHVLRVSKRQPSSLHDLPIFISVTDTIKWGLLNSHTLLSRHQLPVKGLAQGWQAFPLHDSQCCRRQHSTEWVPSPTPTSSMSADLSET